MAIVSGKFVYFGWTIFSLIARGQSVRYPVGLTNCGVSNWVNATPKRAVTMNQGATEVLLALKLHEQMVGTAYLDDEIWPELADLYSQVPVLSDTYPDIDTLMGVRPDFIYASYSSAFRQGESLNYTRYVGPCTLEVQRGERINQFCRKELHDYGIQTYLQTPFCEIVEQRSQVDMDTVFAEIWDIANVFNTHNEARKLIDTIEGHLQDAKEIAQYGQTLAQQPIRVLWLDTWSDSLPEVGACCGPISLILEYSGVENIFKDKGYDGLKTWEAVRWAEIVQRDPDVIIVVDSLSDSADRKIYNLCSHPVTRELRAVQQRAYITVPFSATTMGVRVGALAYNLAEAMLAISRNLPLSNEDFTEVSITYDGDVGGQGVGRSGVRVYTRLPVVNGTDLEQYCPGVSTITIGKFSPIRNALEATTDKETSKGGIPTWSIALMIVLGFGVICAIVVVSLLVIHEKRGKPYFAPKLLDQATMG